VSGVEATAQAASGDTIEVRFRVTNNGINVTESTSWTDAVWLARDRTRPTPGLYDDLGQVVGNGGIFLGARHARRRAGGRRELRRPRSACASDRDDNIGAALQSGRYFITPWADALRRGGRGHHHRQPGRPRRVRQQQLQGAGDRPARADSAAAARPAGRHRGAPIRAARSTSPSPVTWTVQNRELGVADFDWVDAVDVYDRPPDAPGAQETFIGFVSRPTALACGESYTSSLTFLPNPGLDGRYVQVRTDALSKRTN
jgi:hypothetical protein